MSPTAVLSLLYIACCHSAGSRGLKQVTTLTSRTTHALPLRASDQSINRTQLTFHNHSILRINGAEALASILRVAAMPFSNSKTPSFVTYRPQSIQMVKAAAKKSLAKAVSTTKAPPKKVAKANKAYHNKMEAPLSVSLGERVDVPMPSSVGVFCGCRPGAHEEYTVAAVALGTQLARRNITLVYGGGTVGLMGSISRAVLSNGGSVKGFIPNFLMGVERSGEMVGETEVTETMSERKAKIFEASDAVISCPGGLGTFEELSEFLCQRQLGLHQKPIALLNTRGFFNPLLQQFKHMTAEGFLPAAHLSLIVEDDVDTLLDKVPPSP